MGVPSTDDFSIADVGGNGYIDTIALMDGNLENVSYKQASAREPSETLNSLTLDLHFVDHSGRRPQRRR